MSFMRVRLCRACVSRHHQVFCSIAASCTPRQARERCNGKYWFPKLPPLTVNSPKAFEEGPSQLRTFREQYEHFAEKVQQWMEMAEIDPALSDQLMEEGVHLLPASRDTLVLSAVARRVYPIEWTWIVHPEGNSARLEVIGPSYESKGYLF